MLLVFLLLVSSLTASLSEITTTNTSDSTQHKFRRQESEIENIIVAVSQSFAYLISHIQNEKTVNVDSVGATSYVNCVALLLLVVLKCFTIFKKYWKNGEKGNFEDSQT